MKKRQCIMIVDDDPGILKMLGRALEIEGFDVNMATDGGTALTQLEKRPTDMIILDIMMPGMDGFQVLDLVRRSSNVPVIMLSAMCEVTTLRDALVMGADDYIRKPFRMNELIARVRAKLRRAQPLKCA